MRSLFLFPFTFACTSENIIDKQENVSPTILIASHGDGAEIQEGYSEQFRATVSDDDNQFEELQIAWYLGEELVCDWAIASPAGESTCEIVFSPEDINVVSEVRDPQGAGARAEITILVLPTEAPIVEILSPTVEGNYYADQLIEFSALVSDLEDDVSDLMIGWSSSLDGELSISTEPDSSGEISDYGYLTEGQHAIELRVEDSTEKVTTDSVVIEVRGDNNIPLCEVISPASYSSGLEGENIFFEALVSDDDVIPSNLSVLWESDKDGELGSSTADSAGWVLFSYSGLSVNSHVITLRVSDEVGAECTANVFYTVGTPPEITLESPVDGEVYTFNENIIFRAIVSDAQESATNLSLSWESSLDGEFSTTSALSDGTAQFITDTLSAGEHTLTVMATDSDGFQAQDILTFQVNTPPTAPTIILHPDPATTTLSLNASPTSTDADGDYITYSYEWFEDSMATLLTSSNVPISALDVGAVWTVRVTPNDGYVDGGFTEASITISNSDPVISSVSISPSSIVYNDSVLTCSATASDPDETVSPTFEWTVGSTVYSGVTLDLSSTTAMPTDVITCTAVVNDSNGGSDSDSSTVTMDNRDPTVDSVNLIPSTPSRTDTITCAATASDLDGVAPTLSFVFSNQSTLTMYTATTVSISDATLDLSLTAVLTGEIVECMVMAMDVNGATGNDSATVSVINTSPTFSSVASISPSIGVYTGTALTCSATASDPDDGMITPTYEWSVGLVSIGMGSSYTVSALDTNVGDSITCTATATDSDNESTTSAASVSVQNTDPVLVSTSISVSTGYNDDIFSCSSSATDPDELLSISYAWMVDGVLVGSGSSLDLATTSAIPNDVVTCTASVTDSQGATDDDSVNTAILNRFPDTPTIFVTPSNPQAGVDDLFCQMGTLSDPDGSNQVLTESYEWVSSTGVTITGDTVLAQYININETWTCYGTVSDGIDDVVVDASVNSNVSNCPAASVGQTSVGHSNLGYCWYMTLPNGTCDATCGSVGGGSNLMTEAQSLISSNDVNYTDAQETMIHWFYVNGNPANFTGPGSGSWPGLGYGYLNGSYYNRVSGMNSAAFPGNTRGTDADRIFVCACTHDN